MRACHWIGASAIAIAASSPMLAQAGQSQAAELGEIVVTATLKNETLQKVPLAITVIDQQMLERAGIKDLRDLGAAAASFNLTNSNSESGGSTIRIRGVGTTGNNTGLESAVGIFIDGVYLSRPGIALGDLLDVQQIEVLRGPQGTLFGRNTSAGALNIRTRKPNLEAFEGYANATYGNYDLVNLQGGISAPIVEGALALRVSGAYRKRDGYITSTSGVDSNNRNRYIIRGQLEWQPSADLSIRLIGDYSKSDERCCEPITVQDTSFVSRGLYTAVGLPSDGGISASGDSAVASRTGNGEFQLDRLNQWGASGQIDWRLGDVDLVSITAYRRSSATPVANSDFTSLKIFSTSDIGATSTGNAQQVKSVTETFSQELRLSGSLFNDRLSFLVGGYYLDENISELQSLTLGSDFQRNNSVLLRAIGITALGANPALALAQNVNANSDYANNLFTQQGRNWSLFTNETFKVTDRLSINVGARYSDDRKAGKYTQVSARSSACTATLGSPIVAGLSAAARGAVVGLACFPFATQANLPGAGTAAGPPTPAPFDLVFSDSELSYTGKILWEPFRGINTYASFTHGYKSGGFNLDPSAAIRGADPRFGSEQVDAYELGLKAQIGRSVVANFAVFDQHLKGFQVLEFTGVQFVTFNVAKARSTGAEFEITARVSPSLTANASYTFTNARYPIDCAGTSTNPSILSLCGQTLTNAPRHVVISGLNYDRNIGRDLNISLNGSVRLESDRRTSTQAVVVGTTIPTPFDIQDGNAKVDLRFGVGSQNGVWRIEVWGNNLTDAFTRSVTFNTALRGTTSATGGANAIGQARSANFAEPRTFGVTLRSRF